MKRFFLLCISVLLLSSAAFAQCKGFERKECLPKLAPYTHNGQLNRTTLFEGQAAEMLMTFYSGQKYKILICAQDVLEGVKFRLLDMNKLVVFSSTENGNPDSWEFKVETTQQFIIQVVIPKPEDKLNSDMLASGCVSVLVGFQKAE